MRQEVPQSNRGPESGLRPRGSAWRLVGRLGVIAFWLPALAMVMRNPPYLMDLACQFGVHGSVALTFIGIVFVALQRWWAGAHAMSSAIVTFTLWWAACAPPIGPGATPEGFERIRIVHYNAFGPATRTDADFARWLREIDPEIVVLVDAPWAYSTAQTWIPDRFPHRIEPEPGRAWPYVILSRFPLEDAGVAPFSEATQFSFVARRSVVARLPGGGRVMITAMNPASPRSPSDWRLALSVVRRDGPLIRAWRERTNLPVIVAGDFNSAPTGRVHRTFARESGLIGWSPAVGAGTWPSWLSPWLSVPIDRFWSSPDVRLRTLRIAPRFRSDHRAIVGEFDVPVAAASGP